MKKETHKEGGGRRNKHTRRRGEKKETQKGGEEGKERNTIRREKKGTQ